jgi:putative endonuclease
LPGETGPYQVYIVRNPKGRFYIGQTDDLSRRISEHNDPLSSKSKYAVKNGPWTLVWSETPDTRSLAMRRERKIKSKKSSVWIERYMLNR